MRAFEAAELDGDELAAALGEIAGPGVAVIDDADLIVHCETSKELSHHGTERRLALVFAGDTDVLSGEFGGWHLDARRARPGVLTAGSPRRRPHRRPAHHGHLSRPAQPGRALLNTGNGTLTTVAVPLTV